MSAFQHVPLAPPNSIFGVNQLIINIINPIIDFLQIAMECKNDPHPEKIDLTIGAYRTNEGEIYVMPSVAEAERRVMEAQLGHEYLPLLGKDGLLTSKYAQSSNAQYLLQF